MSSHFFNLAFTPAVQAEQMHHGSRTAYARLSADTRSAVADTLSAEEIAFLQARDSFYLASVSESGWPYVQHRGGPVGFVRVLDEGSFGWLEFTGNRQYISAGNAAAEGKVATIFVDYPNRRRLKVLGHMRMHDLAERPDLALRLGLDGYRAHVERAVTVQVEAFDWNCPQHIVPRFTMAEIRDLTMPLHERIAELERRVRDCGPDGGSGA